MKINKPVFFLTGMLKPNGFCLPFTSQRELIYEARPDGSTQARKEVCREGNQGRARSQGTNEKWKHCLNKPHMLVRKRDNLGEKESEHIFG